MSHTILLFSLISVMLVFLGCGGGDPPQTQTTLPIQTRLLVGAPTAPLPLNQPVTVTSITETESGVSHVELYAVQLPTGEENLLLNTQVASVNQNQLTSEQTFVPILKGHYAIKVVGYSADGQQAESETISFEVE